MIYARLPKTSIAWIYRMKTPSTIVHVIINCNHCTELDENSIVVIAALKPMRSYSRNLKVIRCQFDFYLYQTLYIENTRMR